MTTENTKDTETQHVEVDAGAHWLRKCSCGFRTAKSFEGNTMMDQHLEEYATSHVSTTCVQCEQMLTPVVPEGTTRFQFDNALWIGFFGGYGMFVESPDFADTPKDAVLPDATREAVLCHDCAHLLCETFPWVKALLQPYTSHTHTLEYWKENPDHDGIDKDV